MYPVRHKNYSQDIFIKDQWNAFDDYIRRAGIMTIWGYSAPDSDEDAKKRMLKAFSKAFRKLDQIEIIDIASKDSLTKKWRLFIEETNFHLNIYESLKDSIIAEFPRRSLEGYTKRYIDGWWGKSNLRLKECDSFDDLKKLFAPLMKDELNNKYEVI